ncbi:MAG: hypothetical protein JNM45_05660 [Rhizobiales bacterium]|nr:hypothetical protein [Hyphomicrobiales bacterium]
MSVELYQKISVILDDMQKSIEATRQCAEGDLSCLKSRLDTLESRISELKNVHGTKLTCGTDEGCWRCRAA